MKHTVKFISLILALCAVLSLTSCGFIKINHKSADTAAETVDGTAELNGLKKYEYKTEEKMAYARQLLDSVENTSFETGVFTVAVYDGFSFAPISPSNAYEAAVIERNSMIEKKYNVTLKELETPKELLLTDSYNAYLSGLEYADILVIPACKVGEFAEKGYLLNLKSLDGFSADAEYFDSSAMEQMTAGLRDYAVCGTFTRDIGSYYCIYVNTDMLSALSLESPVSYVKNGTWTWDKLLEYVNCVGTGYSVSAESNRILANTVYKSSGLDYMSTGFNQVPKIAYNNETTDRVRDILHSLLCNARAYIPSDGSDVSEKFANGEVLFAVDTVSNMSKYANLGRGWTVLPVPKLSAEQEDYIAYLSPDAPVAVVSSGTLHPKSTAVMLKALNAASYGTLDDGYYDYLTVTAVNSSETLDMLDYVCGIKAGKARIDFIDLYSEIYPQIYEDTADTLIELALNPSLDRSTTVAKSDYDLNWRMVNAFFCAE